MSHLTKIVCAVVLSLVVSSTAAADRIRSLSESAKPGPGTIAQVAWLAGRWVGEGFGGKLEEVWSPPDHGTMVGHFFASDEKGISFIELVEIKEESGTLSYHVKHFNPDYIGWEDKDKFITFPLVSIDGRFIYFDGLTIRRLDSKSQVHYLRMKHKDGTIEDVTLNYHRVN
jgi:hypothetical protein